MIHSPPNSFAHVAHRSWIFFSSMLGSEIFSQQCLKVHPPRLYTSELRAPGGPRCPRKSTCVTPYGPMDNRYIFFYYALSSNWLPRDKIDKIDKIDNYIYRTSIYCTYTVHIYNYKVALHDLLAMAVDEVLKNPCHQPFRSHPWDVANWISWKKWKGNHGGSQWS